MLSKTKLLKTRIIPVLLLICLIVCYFTGVPRLPMNKTFHIDTSSLDGIMQLLISNFVPTIYFCISIVFGLIVFYLGISLHKKLKSRQTISSAFLSLSSFILISGIWIITDSTLMQLFTSSINYNAVVLISFLSFMLMPIAFVSCVNRLLSSKIVSILDLLFCLNAIVFMVLVMLKVNIILYFCSLAIHHILIIVTVSFLIFSYFHKKRQNKSVSLPFGVLVFFLAIILTLVLFLLNYVTLYPVALSVALISLAAAVFKYILDDTIHLYEEQIQSDIYKKMAYTDALCGIQNRNAFELKQKETASCSELCYVVFDINNLKPINDKYGHSAGDYLIFAAATLIHNCFSSIGDCFRIGGDEFSVICTNQDESVIHAALEKLQQDIEHYNSEYDIKISLAYGTAFRNTAEISMEQLFQNADQAMYQCKQEQKRLANQQ